MQNIAAEQHDKQAWKNANKGGHVPLYDAEGGVISYSGEAITLSCHVRQESRFLYFGFGFGLGFKTVKPLALALDL